MKIVIRYLLFFLLFLSFYSSSFASDSIDFYRNVLSQQGIYTDILKEQKEDPLNKYSEDILVSTGRDTETLLLKASQFNKYIKSDGFGIWNRVLIVCDTSIDLDLDIRCDFNGISANNILSQEIIFPKNLDNVEYFYIPEKYFTYPSERNTLEAVVSKLSNIEDSRENLLDTNLSKDTIKVAEFFRYVLVLFLIFNVLYYIVPFISSNPSVFLQRHFYETLFVKFFTWLSSFKRYNIYLLLIAFFSYPVILVTISFRDLGIFDFEYVIKFLFDTLNPSNFPVFLEYRNIAKVALFISNYFLTTLVFLTISPFLFFNMRIVLSSLILPSKSSRKYLYLYFSGLFILLMMVLFDVFFKYSFLFLVSLLIVFTLPLFIELHLFNLNNKFKLGVVVVFIILFLFIKFLVSENNNSIQYKSLLASGKSSVFTPYTKQILFYERLKPFIISSKDYLFANEFLLVAPNINVIKTLSISDFSKDIDSKFLFVASSIDTYAKYLLADQSLVDYVKSDVKTKLFIVKSEDIINKDAYIRMTFNCSYKPKVLNITAKVYENSFYGERNLDLFTFPGCEKGIAIYNFPINYSVIDSKYALFSLMGLDLNYISNIELIDNITSTPLVITFIKDPTNNMLIYNNVDIGNSKELKVFIFDELDSIQFSYNSSVVDLSIPLNMLLDNGLIEKSFTIWSPKGNVIIDSGISY